MDIKCSGDFLKWEKGKLEEFSEHLKSEITYYVVANRHQNYWVIVCMVDVHTPHSIGIIWVSPTILRGRREI